MAGRVGPILPRTIEMTPSADGGFVPDFNASFERAGTLARPNGSGFNAPQVPRILGPSSAPRYEVPDAVPTHDSGTRGFNASDAAEFGNDEFGRPIVTPRRGGDGYEINPELDFTPDEISRANRELDRGTSAGGSSSSTRPTDRFDPNGMIDPFGTADLGNAIGSGIGGAIRGLAGRAARALFPESPDTYAPGAPSGRPVYPGGGQGSQTGVLYDIEVECQCEFFRFNNSPSPDHTYVGYYIGEFIGPFQGIQVPGVLGGGLGAGTPAALLNGLAAGVAFGLFAIAAVPDYPKNQGNNQATGPLLRVTIRRRDGQPEPQPTPSAPRYPDGRPYPIHSRIHFLAHCHSPALTVIHLVHLIPLLGHILTRLDCLIATVMGFPTYSTLSMVHHFHFLARYPTQMVTVHRQVHHGQPMTAALVRACH